MKTVSNKVQLTGNLGKTPEVKIFDGGRKMARMSIATNESYENKKGEKVTQTYWHNLVAWGEAADVAEKFQKGSRISVEGKLTNRNFTDKDGNKKFFTEVQVFDLKPVEKGEEN